MLSKVVFFAGKLFANISGKAIVGQASDLVSTDAATGEVQTYRKSWRENFFEGVPSPAGGILVLTPLIVSVTSFDYIALNYDIIVPASFIVISLLLISKFPSYSFKKIIVQRKATIFLLFGIVLFLGLLLIYPFNVIAISAVIYLLMLPISFFHYQKLKKQNQDSSEEDDDLEDVL